MQFPSLSWVQSALFFRELKSTWNKETALVTSSNYPKNAEHLREITRFSLISLSQPINLLDRSQIQTAISRPAEELSIRNEDYFVFEKNFFAGTRRHTSTGCN
jgi:hypothetical protein